MNRSGGCHCGAVRFSASGAPLHIVHCHCTDCRRASGAPAVAWATYPAEAVAFEGAALRWRKSSEKAERAFCRDCGSPLAYRNTEGRTEIDLTVGTFDEPESLRPERHIFERSRLSWFVLADDLPRHKGWSMKES